MFIPCIINNYSSCKEKNTGWANSFQIQETELLQIATKGILIWEYIKAKFYKYILQGLWILSAIKLYTK